MQIVVEAVINHCLLVAPEAAESKQMLRLLILLEIVQRPRTSVPRLLRNSLLLRSSSNLTRSVRLPSVLSHYVILSNSLRLLRVSKQFER